MAPFYTDTHTHTNSLYTVQLPTALSHTAALLVHCGQMDSTVSQVSRSIHPHARTHRQ